MVTYPSTHGVFEAGIVRHLRHRARARRPGVRRRRQPERAGRPRRARASSAPTSRTSTCTRRSAFRTAAADRASGPVACKAHLAPFLPGHRYLAAVTSSARANGWRNRRGRGGAVRHRVDPADLVDVHRDDGRRGPARRDRERDPRRELRRAAPRAALSGALQRAGRARRARMHPRPAAAQGARAASRSRTSRSA